MGWFGIGKEIAEPVKEIGIVLDGPRVNGYRILAYIGRKHINGRRQKAYLIECKRCGQEFENPIQSLKQPERTGCIKCRYKGRKKKGLLYDANPRLYSIYNNMKNRCQNANARRYKDYGGRGIKVCEEWNTDFESFVTWANANGYSDMLTLERINNNGNYCPKNCKWIPLEEQALNTRQVKINKTLAKLIDKDLEKMTISQVANKHDISTSTVQRVKYKKYRWLQ